MSDNKLEKDILKEEYILGEKYYYKILKKAKKEEKEKYKQKNGY